MLFEKLEILRTSTDVIDVILYDQKGLKRECSKIRLRQEGQHSW